MAHSAGTGSLVWAGLGNRPCDDSDKVEGNTNQGGAEDDRSDGEVDLPEVAGESATEEQ